MLYIIGLGSFPVDGASHLTHHHGDLTATIIGKAVAGKDVPTAADQVTNCPALLGREAFRVASISEGKPGRISPRTAKQLL